MPDQLTRLNRVEQKVNALEDRYKTLLGQFGSVRSQLSPILSAGNESFLSGLSLLPHQTTSNATISTTAGTFTNSERVAFNGLVNAVNNLQSNLQSNNFEA